MGPACLLVCTDNQGHRPNSLASSDLSLPCGEDVPFWGQRLSAALFFPHPPGGVRKAAAPG